MEVKKLTLLGATQGFSVEEGHIYRPQFAYGIVENKADVLVKVKGMSVNEKRKREKGFVLPNNRQILELRKVRQVEKLPPIN